MANINPFEKGFNTQGNTQFYGIFSNTIRTITPRTNKGSESIFDWITYNSPFGKKVISQVSKLEPGSNVYSTLFNVALTPSIAVSSVHLDGAPLFRIKLSTGYYCGFYSSISNRPVLKTGFFSSDTADYATSGFIGGANFYCGYNTTATPYIFTLGKCLINGVVYVGVFVAGTDSSGGVTNSFGNFFGVKETDLLEMGASQKEISTTFGEPSKEEGYTNPTFDDSSDTISVPNVPVYGATSGGFINAYSVTTDELVNIGSELFPNLEIDYSEGELIQQTLVKLGNQIGAIFKNNGLINYILDCHIIPVTPSVGNRENVKVGYKSLSQSCLKANSDYIDIDCGSITISEFYNNFIDYITNAKIYLPFIGFVPVKPEFFQNGNLTVKYRFNIVDGSFMCYILSTSSKSKLTNSVVATYSGVACSHIPLSGANYAAMVSGIINGGASTLANISSGNVLGGITSAMNTIANKPDMQQSNGFNSSSALLSPRKPYLLIERPVSNISSKSPGENGFPLNVTYKLNELSGLTILENPILNDFDCTDKEKEMLYSISTTGGIIL